MIDELSMGLAPVIVERLLAVVRTAADELDLSVLLVEQHVRMALGIADSASVISHGRLTTHGSADDVTDQIDAIEASYLGDAG
jgi:branched-chain amino acid transport system ATP-binding protein